MIDMLEIIYKVANDKGVSYNNKNMCDVGKINVYVFYHEVDYVDDYEIDVNDLRQFKHAFVDSFLQWQMFEMTFRKCNYYDYEYVLPKYVHFFYDYLKFRYGIKTELNSIEKIRVTTANLQTDLAGVTIGGDECWT